MYETLILEHFAEYRQMLFLMGPRQVGKTTTTLDVKRATQDGFYYSWDNPRQRAMIMQGPDAIAEQIHLEELGETPLIIFDEIHKSSTWKQFLKGFYDSYPEMAHTVVTGSARLNVFKRGGDSLMGRYLMFRFHPLSLAEVLDPTVPDGEIRKKLPPMDEEAFKTLWKFGGYPDPFLKANTKFFQRWKTLRAEQLFYEDLRDLSRIQELDRVELLAELLRQQVGQLTTYLSIAKHLGVAHKTVRRWVEMLKSVYYCFEVRPWSTNVTRSLIKEPKYYLWDWSLCDDPGARAENFIASHLLKSVHFWNDYGYGDYGLHFLRDRNKREVDFIVTRNKKPWFLVEVKNGRNNGISPHLHYFHERLGTDHAFQVVIDMPYVEQNCFAKKRPIVVPARTFCSQLI